MGCVLACKHPNTLSASATLEPFTPKNGTPFDQGPETPIVQLHGEDSDARTLVVTVQPVFDDAPAGGQAHRFPLSHGPCVALLEWGTGAVTAFAEFDIGKGTCVTVAASSLVLKGRNDGRVLLAPEIVNEFGQSLPAESTDPTPGAQRVVGLISGCGTRPAFGRATRTYYWARLGSAEVAAFPVPPFAKSVLITRAPLSAPIGVEITDGMGSAFRDGQHQFAANVSAGRLELFDIADSVAVRNTGGADIEFIQVQFELAL